MSRVTFGRTRTETGRWVAFRSHYGFDSFYCRPGIEGAHEKGGVEGEVGRFRRQHLVPVPAVDSLAELNTRIEAWDTPTMDAGSARGRAASGTTSPSRPGCSRRCRPRRSTPR